MDGQILRQSSSYRRGLVLGLTMAEIMILLVFCLLIAMAAFMRVEHDKREQAEKALGQERLARKSERDLVADVRESLDILHRLRDAVGSSDPTVVDQYWRELVASHDMVAGSGLPLTQLRDRVTEAATLKAKGIDVEAALRNAEIVGSVERLLPGIRDRSLSASQAAQLIEQRLQPPGNSGHQWPPIINLSEAGGYHFKSRSAELSEQFRNDLAGPIPGQILELMKQYDVDVIEVVGHTDERPLGSRDFGSNLDRELVPVLRNSANIASVVPADNAGLGLARAVSVVSVLLRNKALAGYKLLPLSGAQLINNDETLAISGTPGDILERRRIEIRLRKSSSHDALQKPLPMSPASAPPPARLQFRPGLVTPSHALPGE
jgi:outer membrane protein OmpA-like peptidoglycan-associated protein